MVNTFQEQDSPEVATESERFYVHFYQEKACAKLNVSHSSVV